MRQHAIAVMAIGIAAITSLGPRPALAQPYATENQTRSVPFIAESEQYGVIGPPRAHRGMSCGRKTYT